MVQIPLPEFKRKSGSIAHPYPFQIAFQTKEILQGIMFYLTIADFAAGEYFKQPGAMDKSKEKLLKHGLDSDIWGNGWNYLNKYDSLFKKMVFQNALISMQSQWDWYIRKLSKFISFGRQYVSCSPLVRKDQNPLVRIDNQKILTNLLC